MPDLHFASYDSAPAETLPGFENIKRYWDPTNNVYAAKILPGEYYVTTNRELITTVLGSCVSACIRDPVFEIGGMNHFMLPADRSDEPSSWERTAVNSATRYGNYAMEHLVNEILKHGGRRDHLEVKIFGGGRVLASMTDVGRQNIEFALAYLRTEGFTVTAQDLGDIYPRKINYYPQTGRVQLKKLRSMHNKTVIKREISYLTELVQQPVGGEIDLW